MNSLNSSGLVVSISHSDYLTTAAGVEKVIRSEQQLLNSHGYSYLHLYPVRQDGTSTGSASIRIGVNLDGQPAGCYTAAQLAAFLRRVQAEYGTKITAFHLQHLLDVPLSAVSYLVHELSPQCVRFFIHDFYSLCPQTNLLYNGEVFCNVPEVDSLACASCLKGRFRRLHLVQMRRLFECVTQFVAASESARDLFLRVYPEMESRIRVIPNQRLMVSEPDPAVVRDRANPKRKIRVAYVGQQSFHKGWSTWIKYIEQLPADAYDFYLVGNCSVEFPNVEYVPVSFVKDGKDSMTRMLKKMEIDVAFLWSICPETYSFTFFESMSAGCYIATNPWSGNIAAQVRQHACGVVFTSEQELFSYFGDVQQVQRDIAAYRGRKSRYMLAGQTLLWDGDFSAQRNLAASPDTQALLNMLGPETTQGRVEKSLSGERVKESLPRKIDRSLEWLLPHQTRRRLAIRVAVSVMLNPVKVLQALFKGRNKG